MGDVCPSCNSEFNSVALHWSMGDCEHPNFTNEQEEIIVGLLMGDGNIDYHHDSKNPYLRTNMTAPNYLKYLDDKFGVLSNGVKFSRSSERSAELAGNPERSESYSDLYKWSTTRHPDLQKYADWYKSGEKVWPDELELTPTVLKHWYCGDGHYCNTGGHKHISIAMQNERDNTDKVDYIFTQAGLPAPSNYSINETNCDAVFTRQQSERLWEYMGEPLPDFEYKWPEEYR